MIAWLQTGEGQAVATLVSNALSLVAIVIGVSVALLEQRRANAEGAREQARERQAIERIERERVERRTRFVSVTIKLIDKANESMTKGLPTLGEMYTTWLPDRGKPLELRSLKTTIESLVPAALDDVELILALNKAAAILDVTISPAGFSGAPQVEAVLRMLQEQAAALSQVRASLIPDAERLERARGIVSKSS